MNDLELAAVRMTLNETRRTALDEIRRLRAVNAKLVAACEAARRTFEASDNATSGAETLDLIDAALAAGQQ